MEMTRTVQPILLKSMRLQEGLVYGIVYEPDTLDAHGDWTTAEEIERAAHAFLPEAVLNIQHTAMQADAEVVESYIAPADLVLPGGSTVKKGAWVMVVRVNSESLKQDIERGVFTGFSLEGSAQLLDVELPDKTT